MQKGTACEISLCSDNGIRGAVFSDESYRGANVSN